MQKIIILFNDDTTHEIDVSNIEVSAYMTRNINNINEYEIEDSISLYKNYRNDEELTLLLKSIMIEIQDKIIKEVKWVKDSHDITSISGLIVPRWNLSVNSEPIEVLNFSILN